MKKKNLFTNWKYNSWLFAVVLLLCFAFSAGVRFQQFEIWEKAPNVYFVEERPLMTTLDAPFWFRLAREYNGVKFDAEVLQRKKRKEPEQTKNTKSIPTEFLDHSPTSSETSGINDLDVPLLSFLIAHLTPYFHNNYYLTGTMLIPVLASLFILPLGIYFLLIGLPVSGMLGGLIGTFAGAYYMRSSIGRIDTDMLNLFFPVLTGLFILLASLAKSERLTVICSVLAGLSLFFFEWWYAKAGFTLAFFAVFIFCLFIHQIRFRTILLCSLLFVFFAGPGIFLEGTGNIQSFFKGYFDFGETKGSDVIQNLTMPATFPNAMTTISEVDHLQFTEVFRRILSKPMLSGVGLIAFFVLAILRWRVLMPLLPMLALGLLSLQSSHRFIMFLAPFIGLVLRWIISIVIEGAFYYLRSKNEEGTGKNASLSKDDIKNKTISSDDSLAFNQVNSGIRQKILESDWFSFVRQATLYIAMGGFFWLISSQTAISFVPSPSIHPRIFKTFLEVKKLVSDESKLLTWWDYGHTLNDIGFRTFHDGGGQTSPKTFFIARGLISSEGEELHDITKFLATEGNGGIYKNNTSPEALMQAVRNPHKKPLHPIYLFFTADMTGKYGAISKLGSWDIVKGGSKPRGYQNLYCNKITNFAMDCRGAKIDLKVGKINNRVALKRLLFIRDGQVIREQEFGHAQGFSLQLLVTGQKIVEVQLIDEVVFRSNYNQMFLLGRYSEDLYEETYNAFPFSRLFRFKY